jgi:hypothetical protein
VLCRARPRTPPCRPRRRLSREPEAVREGSRRRSDIGSHPLDLDRVDAEAPCRGAKAHDTQRYSLWCPRFYPVDSQRRMETYDAARAPGARRCEEIVFPSSLSDHVIQAAADPLNRSASNQRGQVSRGQSEVPYLVRPKVRWDALYAEPVKSAVAQTMQSVEIEIEIELGEAIKWSNAAKGRCTNSLRERRQTASQAPWLTRSSALLVLVLPFLDSRHGVINVLVRVHGSV